MDPNKGHQWYLDVNKRQGWRCLVCDHKVETLSEIFPSCEAVQQKKRETRENKGYSVP